MEENWGWSIPILIIIMFITMCGRSHTGDCKTERSLGLKKPMVYKGGIEVDGRGWGNGLYKFISKKSTAEILGLEGGDIILKINNKQMYNLFHYEKVMKSLKYGDLVSVLFKRDIRENSNYSHKWQQYRRTTNFKPCGCDHKKH